MHLRFFLPFALLAVFLSACKQDAPKNNSSNDALSANPTLLGGNWIALDFCSRVAEYGSVLQAEYNSHRPYAVALSFNPARLDSVECFNGMEAWKLPIKITQDTVELQGAVQGKSIFLVYDEHTKKHFTMFDAVSGGSVQMDKFLRSTVNSRNGYEAFTTALNHHLFRGSFTPVAAKGAAEKIVFYPEGIIKGWPEYDRYTVCTRGDCFVMGNELDIITLSNSAKKDSEKTFGFKYNGQNDTLALMTLVDATPGEKGGYTTKGMAYRFARKIPTK